MVEVYEASALNVLVVLPQLGLVDNLVRLHLVLVVGNYLVYLLPLINLVAHLGLAGGADLADWVLRPALRAPVLELQFDLEVVVKLVALLDRIWVNTLLVESAQVIFHEAGVYCKSAYQFFILSINKLEE